MKAWYYYSQRQNSIGKELAQLNCDFHDIPTYAPNGKEYTECFTNQDHECSNFEDAVLVYVAVGLHPSRDFPELACTRALGSPFVKPAPHKAPELITGKKR